MAEVEVELSDLSLLVSVGSRLVVRGSDDNVVRLAYRLMGAVDDKMPLRDSNGNPVAGGLVRLVRRG